MSENEKKFGVIPWVDLTVENADEVRDFYAEVVGWKIESLSMGDYSDYCMMPPSSLDPVAGICHARGENAGLPPQWIIYITVENLDESIAACNKGGGKVIMGPKQMGETARYAVIQDPAGAVSALYEKAD